MMRRKLVTSSYRKGFVSLASKDGGVEVLKSLEVLQCLTFAFQGLARISSLSPGLFVHAKPGCA